MSRSAVNWGDVAAEYITGDDMVTAKSLAEKHGVFHGTVSKRLTRDDWAAQRATHRAATAESVVKKSRELISDQIAERNSTLAELSGSQAERYLRLASAYTAERPGFNDQQLMAALGASGMAALRSLMTSAGIAIDKFRLLSNQTTAATERRNEPMPMTLDEAEALIESGRVLLGVKQRRDV